MPLCPQIVITPITVTSTGMTQTSIIPIVAATTEEIDELQVEIDTIEISVNGKNHIYEKIKAQCHGFKKIGLVYSDYRSVCILFFYFCNFSI